MQNSLKQFKSRGFTIVELLIVIVVIGILATITIITYNGIQNQAIDKGVASDLDGVSSALAHYQVTHNGQLDSNVAWFSGSGANTIIGFTPTNGDVIDVVVNSTDYCIRAYNPNAKTYNSLTNAATIGSTSTACAGLYPSVAAITAAGAGYTPPSVTWTAQTTSTSQNWRAITTSADGTKLVAGSTNSNYLYVSTDSGATWTQRLTAGSGLWSLASSDDGTRVIGVNTSFYSYSTADSGTTWTQQVGPSSSCAGAIASSSDGSKLVTGTQCSAASAFTSTDYGATWVARTSSGSKVWTGFASSSDGTKLVGVTSLSSSGYIYTSPDSGVTWTQQNGPGAQNWSSVSSSSDGTKLVASVTNGYIYTSTDSGVTWTQRTNAGSRLWYAVTSSADGARLAAVAYTGYIYTSFDGGATWTAQTAAGSQPWTDIASSANGTILTASIYGGYIYRGVYH